MTVESPYRDWVDEWWAPWVILGFMHLLLFAAFIGVVMAARYG